MNNSLAPRILYPPGGLLIWLIILLEVITFGVALIAFVWQRADHLLQFQASRDHLNVALGTVNTIMLLISGFFVAGAVHHARQGLGHTSRQSLLAGIGGGAVFVFLKVLEYQDKLEAGLGLYYDRFFTFYWLLTGFHLVHVLVGLAILGYFVLVRRGDGTPQQLEDLEAGAAFWHMCDLIWLLLFPVLYLM
ncbi:MAG TPA: cytochrome c oxidase subunit 3 [Bacteroidales bacterium]|nr:cytochrome c oxidase subunit 3 [Bacteroidales bacterium]